MILVSALSLIIINQIVSGEKENKVTKEVEEEEVFSIKQGKTYR